MGRTPAVGIQNFEEIRTGNCFYADKGKCLRDLNMSAFGKFI